MKNHEEKCSCSKLLMTLMIVCVLLSVATLGIVVYDKFINNEERLEHAVLKPIDGKCEIIGSDGKTYTIDDIMQIAQNSMNGLMQSARVGTFKDFALQIIDRVKSQLTQTGEINTSYGTTGQTYYFTKAIFDIKTFPILKPES